MMPAYPFTIVVNTQALIIEDITPASTNANKSNHALFGFAMNSKISRMTATIIVRTIDQIQRKLAHDSTLFDFSIISSTSSL